MMREPPTGAPEGTAWFGGRVDRWSVALCILGENLDPDEISALLGVAPSSSAVRELPFPKQGRWLFRIDSATCGSDAAAVGDGIRLLLARLPSDVGIWATLTNQYKVDVYCGLFLESTNRGFEISAEISKLLSDRGLQIGFDLYFDPPI